MIAIRNLFSLKAGLGRWLDQAMVGKSVLLAGTNSGTEAALMGQQNTLPCALSESSLDPVYATGAKELVEQQLTRSLNALADTIHAKSQDIRNKSDIFLEFGIADQQIMHAGSLAQLAISYAHHQRRSDVSGYSSSSACAAFEDRKINVQTALGLLKEAEQRYRSSYQNNKKLLDRAFLAREQSLARYRELVANA